MAKQGRSRKPEVIGKGKVTPVQVAFIVDRYLSDNNFIQTRSSFRSEASNLISKSPVQEAPKSLLSLGAILDEYITLKEQKVLVDQEQCRLDHEKLKVQKLLTGMQDVMNAYNTSGNNLVTPPLQLPQPPPPPPQPALASENVVQSGAIVSPSNPALISPAGCYPMYSTSAIMSTSRSSNSQTDPTNLSTPVTNQTTSKRKKCKDVSDSLVTAKRCSRRVQAKDPNMPPQSCNAEAKQDRSTKLSTDDNAPSGTLVQGSNVVKCLFNQNIPSPPPNSSVPKTPTRASSAETHKQITPLVNAASSANITPQPITSTDCTIISSETILVSPSKQLAYYRIEKNRCISTSSPAKTNSTRSTNDHAKGRLDFGASDMPIIAENQTPDGTSTSESDREGDILNMDFPNLDALGIDFNLSDLLVDFDIDGGGLDFSSQQATDYSPDSCSGSPNTSGCQVMSHFVSTTKGILSEATDVSEVPDSVTTVKSVTKRVKISSPAKKQSFLNQENTSA